MSVKSIFQVLVGTIVLLVVASVTVEYYNVSMTSSYMKTVLTRNISRSCDYFSQETYKTNSAAGGGGLLLNSGNAEPIKDKDGTDAVSGVFFQGGSSQEVYDSIYKSNDFKEFLKSNIDYYTSDNASSLSTTPILGLWKNLDSLAYGLFGGTGGITPSGLSADDKELGKYYAENQISALNSGIVYLDKNIVSKIGRWNLVSTLSDGKASNIVIETGDDRNSDYVKYRGFRIYYNTFSITDVSYRAYNISTKGGRDALEKVTNIDANNLYKDGDERDNICVAQIKYNVNVAYFGVTPVRKTMEYLFQNQVKGMDSTEHANITGYDADPSRSSLNNNTNKVTNGAGATTWTSPVSGSIYYYIVR